MILKLKKDGTITTKTFSSKGEVLMNNSDIQNLVFSKFILENQFTFESLFKMFQNYPFFQTLFPLIKDYVNEYELIDKNNKNMTPSEDYFLVLTNSTTILNGFISNEILTEIYNSSDVFQENLNIGLMKIKDYLNYIIALNTLSLFETDAEIKSEDEDLEKMQNPQVYLEIDVLETYDLITFIKTLAKNISACGFHSERNKIIEEMDKERLLIELEADRLTAKIMGELNG